MDKSSIALLAITAVIMSGCQALGRTARVNPASVTARQVSAASCPLVAEFRGDAALAINLDCFKFDADDTNDAYELATRVGSPDQQRAARNRLEGVLLAQADAICEEEKGNLYANRATVASFLDFLSSGFALTSTIVGGDQAKTILSALAGQSTATRTNIDANVYQNQLVPALTKVMDAERNRISVEMDSKRGTSVTNYSADGMIRLANQYHQACSFQKAMQLLLDAGLNKEGLDSIVQDMNLRSAGAALEQSISRGRALGLSDEQLNQLRERYLRVNLQISGNAEAAPVPTPASPPAPEPSPSPTG